MFIRLIYLPVQVVTLPVLSVLQEGLCKFSDCARGMNQDSSMKTALFAVAGVGIAGLTFLLGR